MPSAAPESLESALAIGLAEKLAEWDIASWRGIATKFEPGDVRPLYLGPDEPSSAPDERLLLTVSPSTILRGRIGLTPVSFNWRGAEDGSPLEGLRITGLLYRRLNRLAHVAIGEVRVGLVTQTSAGSIGRDSRRRPGATANYLFRGLNPSVND